MIWFNVKEAWTYLKDNGMVYTIRPNKKINGLHTVKSRFFDPNERVHCTLVFIRELDMTKDEETKQILKKYVAESGFQTVEGWIEAFPKRKLKMRLYQARLCKL